MRGIERRLGTAPGLLAGSDTCQPRGATRLLTLETTRWQYVHGTPDEDKVAPEAYWLDYALMSRPGNDEIQLDLFGDYASNVALYPRFQEYFARPRPPLWRSGAGTIPSSCQPRPRLFADNPNAEVHFLDTGHFALETHAVENRRPHSQLPGPLTG